MASQLNIADQGLHDVVRFRQQLQPLMAAARRGVHCRLMLDSAGSVAFFRSPWAAMMRIVIDHHHFAMLTQVHPAQKHTHQIDLESLDHFNAGSVAESLMAAARRGVHCRLMLDSAGSVAFFRSP
jgi:phosphatidylserine/phosphatidylglycerophosphate/cardiolipin synthase-like enzyme